MPQMTPQEEQNKAGQTSSGEQVTPQEDTLAARDDLQKETAANDPPTIGEIIYRRMIE